MALLYDTPRVEAQFTTTKLIWADHISYIKSKISKGHWIIYKAKKFISKKVLESIYYAFVVLIYCIEMWGHTFNYLLDPIFKL